ncbi:MAG: hypothetical protein ACI4IR_07060 [Eubacterium sp.]
MESDEVGASLSFSGGGIITENTLSHFSFTDFFNEHLPFFLSIGMSYEQYWNDDCYIAQYYRKAYELQRNRINEQLWLQGLYIYEAILDMSPALRAMGAQAPEKYVSEPYPITPEECEKREIQKAKEHQEEMKAKTEAFISNFKLKPSGEEEQNVGSND